MALLDHFQAPLKSHRHWHSFHNAWATFLAAELNEWLPEGWFAEPNVQFNIEIDVAAFDDRPEKLDAVTSFPSLVPGWHPPAPVQTIPFPLVTDSVEVNIYENTSGLILAGAIELISPANKDRAASRETFVSKCETYLQQGAGLLIVDVVTERGGNLHRELLDRLEAVTALQDPLYTAAYRLTEREGTPSLEVWEEPLTVGAPLPTMPLWLRGGLCLPVDLEATYQRTCKAQRIDCNGN